MVVYLCLDGVEKDGLRLRRSVERRMSLQAFFVEIGWCDRLARSIRLDRFLGDAYGLYIF